MDQTSLLKLIASEPLARVALALPAGATLLGSVLMAFGAFLPCLLVDAFGFLAALVILIALVLKYLWIEHLLLVGEQIVGRITALKDNEGFSIAQTTELEYEYIFKGTVYRRRVLVHLGEGEDLGEPTIMLDPDKPESSVIKELYCVAR